MAWGQGGRCLPLWRAHRWVRWLVQASQVEMLFDDSRRYVNRAQATGSPVRLQCWGHMIHVWQIFNPGSPQAREALSEIGKFLAAAAPRFH